MAETAAAVEHVRSRDGTPIGYHRSGNGPPVVLLHGATSAHWSFDLLLPHLVDHVTVYAVDRRGRGESGDTADYAIGREFEDAASVLDSIPEPAALLGHSFGATVAIGAAQVARNLASLILYEPAPGFVSVPAEDVADVEELAGRGEREAALVHAYTAFGFTQDELEQLRSSPTWEARLAFVHAVPREIKAEEGYRPDPARLGEVNAPTLLLLGGESPAWAREGTERIRAALPDARVVVLPGQGHMAHVTAPELVAAEILRFLTG